MASRPTSHPVDRNVGARIRMRRLMLGMSQTGLADAIGLTFQQVQKYEKGANRVSASRLQQIAAVLQVSVPFFFENTAGEIKSGSREASPQFITDFIVSKDGIALADAFRQIRNAKIRRRIVDLVEQLADYVG